MDSTLSLQEMWNSLFDSILFLTEEGVVHSLNRPASRLFTGGQQSLIGSSILELIPSEELRRSLLKKSTVTGIPISLGTQQHVGNLSFLESGYYLLVLKNMTQVHQLQHQLMEANEQKQAFDMILDHLEEGICAVDPHGTVIFYNRKMGEIDMLEPESVRTRRIQEIWNVEESNSTLLTCLRTGRILNQRETHFTTNGKAVTTLTKTIPIYIENKKLGALEISKDITEQKQLTETIMQMQKRGSKEDSVSVPRTLSEKNNTRFHFESIKYSSREMRQTVEQARRSARSASNILIVGETGTGKELFAQSIHNESPRKNKPFIAQNCAALPETLLEGLLLGTTAGSFTGAVDRAGLLEQAQGGTLLLDEINSMSPDLQAKLLRVLQERKIQRLGSSKILDIDVRVIATMNEDPMQAISHQRLREDLYYRLGVVNIVIPPLRNRKDDIPILIDHFLAKHAPTLDVVVDGMEDDVFHFLLHYSWPGNVRQLEHVIEGCLNLIYDESRIGYDHLPPGLKTKMLQQTLPDTRQDIEPSNGTLPEQLEKLERLIIDRALKDSRGNVTKASEQLGISRQNLNYKLKKFHFQS
ncbi:sigma 54-interacting transcriptional regulator [Ammoniphilus sp. CFH 90114]|uniref:sigma 54-interacting transcriptional regulator n=1 Tax=Ammoniphilus sp. CFH 90114 TaxID=2493665 RepID=UPI00100F6DB2|nr:sigma 54-interacting transcriptional regulator [Ammoniphilus sp. CFH 90114]RXT06543.1 PAS domain S-box protein [Ammoniphilus sp. CFH 90114]